METIVTFVISLALAGPLQTEGQPPPGFLGRGFLPGLGHVTKCPGGETYSWHLVPYFSGPDYRVLFPFFYAVGKEGAVHHGILPPTFFQGPGYWAAPPFLSGNWTYADGTDTTWITPLFHSTRDKDGALDSLHVGPYFQGKDYWAVPPLLSGSWSLSDGTQTTWIIPFFNLTRDPTGSETSASLLWPLFHYREGDRLDTSWTTEIRPFVLQESPDEYEFNFLRRLFSTRKEGQSSNTWVFPFWWSECAETGAPLEFQILGGLVAQDCEFKEGWWTRTRIFWFIPFGAEKVEP
jgi:hypothetical protein